ncbi:MAG: hypothetical protein Q9195_004915 [Heterodermia aff. obscurata]
MGTVVEAIRMVDCKLEAPDIKTSESPDSSHHLPLTPEKASSEVDANTVLPSDALLPHSYLPPTPQITPQLPARQPKRPLPADIESSPSAGRTNKRIAAETTITPSSCKYLFPPASSASKSTQASSSSPKFSPFRKPDWFKARDPPSISAIELKRAAEFILKQVDWQEMAQYVAANRKAGAYREVVKALLQKEVDALFDKERREGE